MPLFYFDIDDGSSKLLDDEGYDLPDLGTAERVGFEFLGEAIIHRGSAILGEVYVDVRSETEALLRLSVRLTRTATTTAR